MDGMNAQTQTKSSSNHTFSRAHFVNHIIYSMRPHIFPRAFRQSHYILYAEMDSTEATRRAANNTTADYFNSFDSPSLIFTIFTFDIKVSLSISIASLMSVIGHDCIHGDNKGTIENPEIKPMDVNVTSWQSRDLTVTATPASTPTIENAHGCVWMSVRRNRNVSLALNAFTNMTTWYAQVLKDRIGKHD